MQEEKLTEKEINYIIEILQEEFEIFRKNQKKIEKIFAGDDEPLPMTIKLLKKTYPEAFQTAVDSFRKENLQTNKIKMKMLSDIITKLSILKLEL